MEDLSSSQIVVFTLLMLVGVLGPCGLSLSCSHSCGWFYIHLVVCISCFKRKDVLNRKGIHVVLFSISVTVSLFLANGGLVPTNENMAIFSKNSGLLLLIVLQVLAGNLLFPLFLRLVIWFLKKITTAEEFKHPTVIGFIASMVVLFCSLNWNSAVFDGLNSFQKIVNALFMARIRGMPAKTLSTFLTSQKHSEQSYYDL
uniref:Uncharacterized protein n=1 Tax=Ananas comosus var. bracteatus TaxID=296719 RepID=A0A6V7P3M4_ANACO|nr:unnamed protein product [Ananas comosus var. bracteatus]